MVSSLTENSFVCPDLVATGKGGRTNPFYLPTCVIHRLPRSAVLNVVSTAIGHRLMRSYARPLPPSDRAALATRLQKHRGESIRALTADLAEQNTQMSDGTLGAVLALLLSEVSCPFSHFPPPGDPVSDPRTDPTNVFSLVATAPQRCSNHHQPARRVWSSSVHKAIFSLCLQDICHVSTPLSHSFHLA